MRRPGRPAGFEEGTGVAQLDLDGLESDEADLAELLKVDPEEWKAQLPQGHEHYARFGDSLPDELRSQLEALEERLRA